MITRRAAWMRFLLINVFTIASIPAGLLMMRGSDFIDWLRGVFLVFCAPIIFFASSVAVVREERPGRKPPPMEDS